MGIYLSVEDAKALDPKLASLSDFIVNHRIAVAEAWIANNIVADSIDAYSIDILSEVVLRLAKRFQQSASLDSTKQSQSVDGWSYTIRNGESYILTDDIMDIRFLLKGFMLIDHFADIPAVYKHPHHYYNSSNPYHTYSSRLRAFIVDVIDDEFDDGVDAGLP
jgi:hypothetical protein